MGASTIAKQARRSAGVSAARRVAKARRHFRLRKHLAGSTERPRLVVTRSSRHLFAQIVDDSKGVTLASASTYKSSDGDKKEQAKQAGTQLADYKLPAELVILSALPRNASGKVIKKQLAAQLAEQLAGTRSPSAPART